MSVLLIDSNGELWHSRVKDLNVDYVKMPYSIDGVEYVYDLGEKFNFKEFYEKVRDGVVPVTSALNPENYKDILEPYFKDGQDVLYVSFSHAMSGTFNQLDKAYESLKETYPKRKLTVFDTKSIHLGCGIQQEKAAILKNAGKSDKEIISELKKFTNKVCVYFIVDDLMHLKRGGRLSGFAAFAGTLLSLKPMLTTDENGSLKVINKIAGKKKALTAMAQLVCDQADENCQVYVVDADKVTDGDFVENIIKEKRPDLVVLRQSVGPVIGTHCGPGTIGVIFEGEKRPIAVE